MEIISTVANDPQPSASFFSGWVSSEGSWGPYTLFNRVTISWQEIVMGTATVVAAAAAAHAFFASYHVYCFSYTILTLATATAAYYLRGNQDLEDLSTAVSKHETNNRVQAASIKKLKTNVDELSRTKDAYAKLNQQYATTTASLQKQFGKLFGDAGKQFSEFSKVAGESAKDAKKQLKVFEAQITGAVIALTETSKKKDDELAALRELASKFKVGNDKAGQNTERLIAITRGFQESEENLKTADKKLQETIRDLQKERNANELLLKHMKMILDQIQSANLETPQKVAEAIRTALLQVPSASISVKAPASEKKEGKGKASSSSK